MLTIYWGLVLKYNVSTNDKRTAFWMSRQHTAYIIKWNYLAYFILTNIFIEDKLIALRFIHSKLHLNASNEIETLKDFVNTLKPLHFSRILMRATRKKSLNWLLNCSNFCAKASILHAGITKWTNFAYTIMILCLKSKMDGISNLSSLILHSKRFPK